MALGGGADRQPITAALVIASILEVAAAVCLWWLYFDVVSVVAGQRFLRAHGASRVRLAIG